MAKTARPLNHLLIGGLPWVKNGTNKPIQVEKLSTGGHNLQKALGIKGRPAHQTAINIGLAEKRCRIISLYASTIQDH